MNLGSGVAEYGCALPYVFPLNQTSKWAHDRQSCWPFGQLCTSRAMSPKDADRESQLFHRRQKIDRVLPEAERHRPHDHRHRQVGEADLERVVSRYARFAAARRPVSCHHPVLEVRDARRLDRADLLQLHLRVPEVVEETSASPSSTGTTSSSSWSSSPAARYC